MSFIEGIREAQKEVNRVLLESRALLQAELLKIKAALEPINLEVAKAKKALPGKDVINASLNYFNTVNKLCNKENK